MELEQKMAFTEIRNLVVTNTLAMSLVFPAQAVILAGRQESPTKAASPWYESLTPAAKGTRVVPPTIILDEITRDSVEDCSDLPSSARSKFDAYRFRGVKVKLLGVWARNACFCGATGNCEFWVYRRRGERYETVLKTDMVNDFGFLHSITKGLPDLVLWSHDSAQRHPGTLWKFDGETYQPVCSWQVTSVREMPDGEWKEVAVHIANNTCGGPDEQPYLPKKIRWYTCGFSASDSNYFSLARVLPFDVVVH